MEISEKYSKELAKQERRKADLLDIFESTLLHTKSILFEPGCGHGHWLTNYAQANPKQVCVGIDLISHRIRKGKEKATKRKLDNIYFIKAELGESVLTGLKKVFVENYIELPDEKVDLVDDLQAQLNKMESKLNESIEENVGLSKQVGGYIKNWIVTEIAEGLSLSQKEKLVSLAEAVEFENEESFKAKVSTLRESYFSTKPEKTTVSEDVQVENAPEAGSAMDAYSQAIARWAK